MTSAIKNHSQGETWLPYRAITRRHLLSGGLTTLTVISIFLSAGLFAGALWAVQVAPPPFEATLSLVPTDGFCPGDEVDQHINLVLLHPAKLRIDATYENHAGANVIYQISGESWIVHAGSEIDYPVTITRDLSWAVPELEPGIYYRTVGISTEGEPTRPLILSARFSVQQCRDNR